MTGIHYKYVVFYIDFTDDAKPCENGVYKKPSLKRRTNIYKKTCFIELSFSRFRHGV